MLSATNPVEPLVNIFCRSLINLILPVFADPGKPSPSRKESVRGSLC